MKNINYIEKIISGDILIDDLTYSEFLKERKIYSTYHRAKKEGYEAHHIIPLKKQRLIWKEKTGENIKTRKEFIQKISSFDDRCVRLTPFEHIIAHYLLAKEDKEESIIFSNMVHFNFKKLNNLKEREKILKLKELAVLREEANFLRKENWNDKSEEEKERIKKESLESRRKNGNWFPSEETIKKAAQSRIGHTVTEETRKKISEKQKGKITPQEIKNKISNTLKGRKVSEEVKQKISKANKGKIISEEQKLKISQTEKGKIVSKETREKQSLAKIGKPSPRKGQKLNEKDKQFISNQVKSSLKKESEIYQKLKKEPGWNKTWQEFRRDLKKGLYA